MQGMTPINRRHSPGAIQAAEIITGDNYSAPRGTYLTDYGKKTVVGIASIIDDTTAARDLLEVIKAALDSGKRDGAASALAVLNTQGRAAIAKAEGRGPKTDQHGDLVPDDLVTLPDVNALRTLDDLSDLEIKAVMSATWYEANGVLLASARSIAYLSEDDPEDSGLDPGQEVLRVDDRLKRYSREDGFYHA